MKRIYSEREAPAGEQEICVTCGFCCDATLFLQATLQPGERGHLPEKIEEGCITEEGKDYFRQPCGYFCGVCAIYNRQRAQICSTYRCRLLKKFDEGLISQSDALQIIGDAVAFRSEVLADFRRVTGSEAMTGFRRLLLELGRFRKEMPPDGALAGDYEILMVRCNILEALLIKFFLPVEEFEKYVMKPSATM